MASHDKRLSQILKRPQWVCGLQHLVAMSYRLRTMKSYSTGSRRERKRSCNLARDGEGPDGPLFFTPASNETSITFCRALQMRSGKEGMPEGVEETSVPHCLGHDA